MMMMTDNDQLNASVCTQLKDPSILSLSPLVKHATRISPVTQAPLTVDPQEELFNHSASPSFSPSLSRN